MYLFMLNLQVVSQESIKSLKMLFSYYYTYIFTWET